MEENNKKTSTSTESTGLGGIDIIKSGYYGISLLFLLLPVITINFIAKYTMTGFDMAFASLNYLTVYALFATAGLIFEIVPAVRELEAYQKNKKVLNQVLPVVMAIAIIYLLFSASSLKVETLGAGRISFFVYLNVIFQVGYVVYLLFPDKTNELIGKFTNRK